MKHITILITGVTGFIGQEIMRGLLYEGHKIFAVVRDPNSIAHRFPEVKWVKGDFTVNQSAAFWEEKLDGVDIIINAVGIIQQTGSNTFESVHYMGPRGLFQAGINSGIKKVIQISALGADHRAITQYHKSKRAMDDFLLERFPSCVIFRPSIVVGDGGQSTALFSRLAAMPVSILPGKGDYQIQPVHIDDLVRGILCVVRDWPEKSTVLDIVGPHPFKLIEFIKEIRKVAGLISVPVLYIPERILDLIALYGVGLFNKETFTMLKQGSVGDCSAFTEVTGRLKTPLDYWRDSKVDIRTSLFPFLISVLRWSIAFIWIFTGIISAFIYPAQESIDLLRMAGIPDNRELLLFTLYGAAAYDMILGAGVFTNKRHIFYPLQILTVIIYTIILTISQPEFWWHPFGPLSKNIPLLSATITAWIFDQKNIRGLR